eukprot:g18556.t1
MWQIGAPCCVLRRVCTLACSVMPLDHRGFSVNERLPTDLVCDLCGALFGPDRPDFLERHRRDCQSFRELEEEWLKTHKED